MTPSERVLDFVYQRLQIDPEWSVREPDGWTWWAGVLAQRMWAAAPREVDGNEVVTVHVETSLLKDVRGQDVLERLAGINTLATLSAYVWTPLDGRLRLHASVSVTEDNWPLARGLVLHAAAIQAADAHAEAAALADVFGGTIDRQPAPDGAVRADEDEMLQVLDVYLERGESNSPWTVDELASLVHLEPRPWVRASSDATSFEAGLPWTDDRLARLRLDAAYSHPALGSGLHLQLALPVPRATAEVAQQLNDAELVAPDAHQLGAWGIGEDGTLAFTAFFPSASYSPNAARALVYHAAARGQWAAALLAS